MRVSDVLGSNWAVRDKGHGDREALTGFLWLKPDACAKFEKLSGQLGVFVTRLRKPQERGPKPFWIRRLDKEGRDKYFRRVAALQKERGQPILYRAGGGSDLGFEAKDADEEPARAKQLVMQGFPRAWEEEEALRFLSDQKWTDVSFGARRGKRWYLKAMPPTGTTCPTCWRYEVHDAEKPWCLELFVLVRSQHAVTSVQPVRHPRRKDLNERVSGETGEVVGPTSSPPAAPQSTEATQTTPTTQLDDDSSRERSPRRAAAPQEPRQETARLRLRLPLVLCLEVAGLLLLVTLLRL